MPVQESVKSLKGTKTERNLLAAFAGESQARNRYAYSTGQAKKEGFEQIAHVFAETADQEKEHAKRFSNLLQGGDVEIQAAFPAGVLGTTAENLKAAANGEKHEWETMYPEFAKIARDEGLETAAKLFEAIPVAEKQYERRYRGLLKNVENKSVFKKDKPVAWRCRNTHEGPEAPRACPACAHPQAHFEVLAENW